MDRPLHNRSSSDYQTRTSTSSGTRQLAYNHADSVPHLPQPSSTPPVSGLAGRRRHLHHLSLPQNAHLLSNGSHSRPLSPFEERYLGRGTHTTGIPLAEPASPSPSVTGKFLSSVKRAVSLKEKRSSVSKL